MVFRIKFNVACARYRRKNIHKYVCVSTVSKRGMFYDESFETYFLWENLYLLLK